MSKEKEAGIGRDASKMLPPGQREVVKNGPFSQRRSDPKPELPPQREVEEKPRTTPVAESPRAAKSYQYRYNIICQVCIYTGFWGGGWGNC